MTLRKKRLGKKKIVIIAVVAVVLIAVVLTAVLGKLRGGQMEPTTTVSSAEASVGSLSTTISATGTLENETGLEVNVTSGVVITEVLVRIGDTVTEGQQLATVDTVSVAEGIVNIREQIRSVKSAIRSTSDSMRKVVLQAKLDELEAFEDQMEAIYDAGAILATTDGVISQVNVSNNTAAGGSSSSSSSSSSISGYGVSADSNNTITMDLLASDGSGNTIPTTIDPELVSTLEINAPVAGQNPQTEIESPDEFTAEISWDTTEAFAAGYTYTATITLTSNNGYAFGTVTNYSINTDSRNNYVLNGTEGFEGNVLTITAVFRAVDASDNASQNNSNQNSGAQNNGTQLTVPDNVAQNAASDTSADAQTEVQVSGGSFSGVGASYSGSSSSSVSSGSFSASNYDVNTTTAFAINDGTSMLISINIDELDINSVEAGQSVSVTMDALSGQTFSGTVSSVSSISTNNGGNSKFTAVIRVDKADGMLAGMSASAVIYVSEAENVLMVPVAAIHEEGNKSYVYTAQDSDGNPTNMVEVQTGVSNGTNVEIVSGIEEGTTVYYTKIAGDVSGSSNGFDMGNFDFSNMPGGGSGSMPDMSNFDFSNMPSGGSGSMPSFGGGDFGGN